MFQRLLICTDFSDGLQRLANFVPSLAAGGIKQVVFLHSVPFVECSGIPRVDEEKLALAHAQLDPAIKAAPAGTTVHVKIESGQPEDLILKTAKEYTVDLIVLGTPTRNLLTEKLFGSTTMAISQRTAVPLLVLRPQLIETYTAEELDLRCRHLFRCLLIPYHGSESSQSLIKQIKQSILSRPGTTLERLHLCWVVDGVHPRGLPPDYQVDTARQGLQAVRAELALPHLTVEPIEVRQGDPVVEILDAARDADVSAIATTSGHPNRLLEWSVPHFTNELLRRCWHPIIYFPPQR